MARVAVSAAAVIAFFSASGLAHAELTVKAYRSMQRNDPRLVTYVSGLSQGFFWYNVALQVKNQPRLYCPPKKMVLNVENIFQMIDDEIAKSKTEDNDPIGVILANALEKTFPC